MKRTRAWLICLPLVASLSIATTPPAPSQDQTTSTKPAIPAGGWREGTHYRVIDPPQPTEVPPGQIEVIEFFSFACPRCAALAPQLDEWEKHAPKNVKLRRVHVVYGSELYRSYARLYYTLERIKRTDLYPVIFDAIHKQRRTLGTGNAEDSRMLQASFLKGHGITAEDFERESQSSEIEAAITRAEEATRAYKVTAFPAIAVAGCYYTDSAIAGGVPNVLPLTDVLIAKKCGT